MSTQEKEINEAEHLALLRKVNDLLHGKCQEDVDGFEDYGGFAQWEMPAGATDEELVAVHDAICEKVPDFRQAWIVERSI